MMKHLCGFLSRSSINSAAFYQGDKSLFFIVNLFTLNSQVTVIKFVSDLRQVGGFLRVLVSSTNKTDRHDIAEILLKLFVKHANQNAIRSFSIT
jgi:hypothetical protein